MNRTTILNEYLQPTDLVDFNTQIVKQKALELTENSVLESEKVKDIYHFVRDEIPYTFTHNLQKALELTENSVLESEKVKDIYHFVRDEIPYTFTHNLQKPLMY